MRSANLARVLLAAAAILIASESGASGRRVLVLHSFGRDVEPHAAFSRAFRTELATLTRGEIEYYELSMATAALAGGDSEPAFVRYLAEIERQHRFDLVVSLGGPAARFIGRHRREIFRSVPMLIGSTDSRHLRGVPLSGIDAAVPCHVDLGAIVSNILRVFPETREILVVVGSTPLERFWTEEFRRAVEPFRDRVTFEYTNERSLQRTLERAAAAPAGTAIFYGLMIEDGDGVPHGEEVAFAALHDVATAPLFGVWDYQLGKGVVGGPMIALAAIAKDTARVADLILRGEGAGSFRDPPHDAVTVAYDAAELARWGVPRERLIPGAEVRLEIPSMWQLYRGRILLVAVLCAGQGLLIVWLVAANARARRAEAEIRNVSGRLVAAQEEERARLARELHDDVTQQIARLAIDAGRVEASGTLGDASVAQTIRDLRVGLVRLSEHVHVLSYNLHPSLLDDLGLLEAIQAEADRVAYQWALDVEVVAERLPESTPSTQARCLYRIAQEALRNVVRHARARTIRVRLVGERRGVRLTVTDDGVGFATQADRHPHTLGLASMRERVRIAGGAFAVASAPGTGTTVDAWVPLEVDCA